MPAYNCQLLDDSESTRCESNDLTPKKAAQLYCGCIVDRARVVAATVIVVEVDEDGEPDGDPAAYQVLDGSVVAIVALP